MVQLVNKSNLAVQAVRADSEVLKLGMGLNKMYMAALRMGKVKPTNVLERVKAAAEDYLAHFPPELRGAILLGALASVYGKDDDGADTAVWLAGSKESLGIDSLAHRTIVALRDMWVLDDIIVTKDGLVMWPAGMEAEG